MTLWGKWHVSFCSIKNYLASYLFQACYHNYQHHDIVFLPFLIYTVVSEDIFTKWH